MGSMKLSFPAKPIAAHVFTIRGLRMALFLASGILMLISCRKKDPDEPVPPAYHGTLALGVAFRHNAHVYELGSIYTDAAGHEFRLDTLLIVLSSPYGVDDFAATVADFPQTCLLVDASADNLFLLGEIHSHHLHELRFDIGLSPVLNHADPATTTALSELAPVYSGNTTDGHFFLVVAGQVDGNGDGVLDDTDPTFSFKCMGSGLLRTGMAPAHADLPESGPLIAWAVVDMAILLEGIDLLATASATGNHPINVQLMDQLAEAMEQGH